jgi:hypothetical protein
MLVAVLGACSTTKEAGNALQAAWIGKPADDFFRAYGPPVSSYTFADGGKMYEWTGGRASISLPGSASTSTTIIGNTAVSNTQFFPGGNVYMGCSIRINASKLGIISSIAPNEDSIGMWEMSRCAELFAHKS